MQVAFRDSGVGKELSVDTAYLREYIEFSRSLNFAQRLLICSCRHRRCGPIFTHSRRR